MKSTMQKTFCLVKVLSASAVLTSMQVISAGLAGAQSPYSLETDPDEEQATQAEPEVRTFSPEERREMQEWLRQWEERREELFEELVELVGQGDRLKAYEVLKELHGGGAGIAGSKFELLRMKAEEEKKTLEEMEKRRAQLATMNTTEAGFPAKEKKKLEKSIENIDKRIRRQKKDIETLEEEALHFADQAVVSEMPLIFELLGGVDEDPETSEQDTDSQG